MTVDARLDLHDDPGADLDASASGRVFEERYEPQATLGEGGMGEVLLCRDRCIGREVAMKVVHRTRRSSSADLTDLHTRFLREARVQGQLEHPAIVPVYDLSRDSSGRSFFTMKRVRGETLEAVIGRLASQDARAVIQYTRHKLLEAYARVCLAIDFAHARGVVHRDLKPSNVMLGDFGEVYVLDWGVAWVDGVSSEYSPENDNHAGAATSDDPDNELFGNSGERLILQPSIIRTDPDIILGTPAYMPPEQLRGHSIDARTDVYSLGAILFEMLTFTSFHEWRNASDRERAETIATMPPELADICRRATATHPDDRHRSARELHDEVERFLSGDRDLSSRRGLVEAHISRARELRATRPETAANRARALAEVGRAIALDPNDVEALRILVELLSEPPEEAPPEVVAELVRADTESRRLGLKRAMMLYTLPILLFFLPASLFMGVKSGLLIALSFGTFILSGAVAALCYYKPETSRHVPWVTVASSIAIGVSAVLSGVYGLLPLFAVANTICHAIGGRRHHRTQIIGYGVLALLVPVMLELLGIVTPSHQIISGSLVITSRVFEFHEPLTPIFLIVVNVGLLLFTARFVGQYRDALSRAELRHLSQLWQLRQLVPERVRSATSDRPSWLAEGGTWMIVDKTLPMPKLPKQPRTATAKATRVV